MTGILKVDTIQKNNGATPTAKDLGINVTGNVLQVVHAYMQPQLEGALSSATDCFSCSITPSSTSNKILVLVNMAGCGTRDTGTIARLWLARGSDRTVLCYFADYAGSNTASGVETYPSTTYLDSPNTTSQITYYTRTVRTDGSANVYINHYRGGSAVDRTQYASSSLTLMEIAG